MFNAITQRMQDYYDQIPCNTLSTIAKATTFSFAAALNCEGIDNNKTSIDVYATPLLAAGVGALATLIHALMTPIFNAAFENDHQVIVYQECIKSMVTIGLTRFLVSYATGQKVDLLANTVLALLSTNLMKSLFHLVPQTLFWLGDPIAARSVRNQLSSWGLDTPDGANTTYLVF